MKELRRSKDNQVFAGVLAGFGEYFTVDPVFLRVIFIFFVLVTGIFPGVIAYIVAIFLIPLKNGGPKIHNVHEDGHSYNQT